MEFSENKKVVLKNEGVEHCVAESHGCLLKGEHGVSYPDH